MFILHSFIGCLLLCVINKNLQPYLQCKLLALTMFVYNLNFKNPQGIMNLTKSFKN